MAVGGLVAATVGLIVTVNALTSTLNGQSPGGLPPAGPLLLVGGLVAIPVGLVLFGVGAVRTGGATDDWRAAHPSVPVPP